MTRFARMAKKKYLEASSWEELSQQKQAKQNGTSNDEQQKIYEDPKPESKKKKKKSKKQNLETEDTDLYDPVSTPKKQKRSDSNASESKTERKKDKKKGKFCHKDIGKKITKDTLKDKTKVSESQGMKAKCFRSHREEKLEKQREARRRRRAKRKGLTCFHCRQLGHLAAECPQMNQEGSGIGVCYKCGSSDHTTKNCKQKDTEKAGNPFPFAKCFICGETGHLSNGCPDNPKGLYPKGGGCNICGSVEHLKRDCPEAIQSRQKDGNVKGRNPIYSFKSGKHKSADAEVHSDDEKPHLHKRYHKKNKFVKF